MIFTKCYSKNDLLWYCIKVEFTKNAHWSRETVEYQLLCDLEKRLEKHLYPRSFYTTTANTREAVTQSAFTFQIYKWKHQNNV